MVQLILFNGPPHSGKDECSNIVKALIGDKCYQAKNADPLRRAMFELTGADEEDRARYETLKADPVFFETIDDEEMDHRDFMIWLSEEAMKPKFGKEVFGKLLAKHLSRHVIGEDYNTITLSDSGFKEEVVHPIKLIGKENTLLVRIHREGCTFKGDSRDYLKLPGIRAIDYQNPAPYPTPKGKTGRKLLDELTLDMNNLIKENNLQMNQHYMTSGVYVG